jgi:hypothetical protein
LGRDRYTFRDTRVARPGKIEEIRGFSPDFERGGMAEWSMAVVLKTDPADPQNPRISS